MDLKQLKASLLKNPKFKEEYYKKDLAFEVGQMVLEARGLKLLSQTELAELAGTKQPSIARVENGHLPTLNFLEKLAKAMGTYLIPPKFGFMKDVLLEAYDETPTITTNQVYLPDMTSLSEIVYPVTFELNTVNRTFNK